MFYVTHSPRRCSHLFLGLKGAILRAALATNIARPQYRFSRPSLMASSCAVRFISQHVLLRLYFWRASAGFTLPRSRKHPPKMHTEAT